MQQVSLNIKVIKKKLFLFCRISFADSSHIYIYDRCLSSHSEIQYKALALWAVEVCIFEDKGRL